MFVVYLTMYSGNLLPKWYIGSSSEEKVKNGYNGSVSSRRFKDIYIKEQKDNKHLFRSRILSYHSVRDEATNEEKRLQRLHKVVNNELYINQAYADKTHCFELSQVGELNPMHDKGYKLEGKKNGRHHSNYDYTKSDVGSKISKSLKENGNVAKDKNPASKKYYIKHNDEFIDLPKGYLYSFCVSRKLKYNTLYNTLSTKKPVTRGCTKDYQLFEGSYEK
jgi:hypothetical protein